MNTFIIELIVRGDTRVRDLSEEPDYITLVPELSANINTKIQVRALRKIRLSRAWAYLLRAKYSARAFEPEPRLVPPLISGRHAFYSEQVRSIIILYVWILWNYPA